MKQKNYFYKALIISSIWIVFFVGLTTIATERAFREDPEILKKIASRLGAKITADHSFGLIFEDGTESLDLGQIRNTWNLKVPNRKVELNIINADLEISTSETEEISIEASGVMAGDDGSKLLNFKMDEGNLQVSTPETVEANHLKIQIRIPSAFHRKLAIKTVQGNLLLRNLDLESLEIRTVSGDVRLYDVVANLTEVKTVSAEVQIENKKQGNFNIVTVSGDIGLKFISAADTNFEVETLTGEYKNDLGQGRGSEYKIFIKTTNGEVQVGPLNP
ncbi:MAG: DUF4097 family beta strand repeat-containing protein [Kaistella sp.]